MRCLRCDEFISPGSDFVGLCSGCMAFKTGRPPQIAPPFDHAPGGISQAASEADLQRLVETFGRSHRPEDVPAAPVNECSRLPASLSATKACTRCGRGSSLRLDRYGRCRECVRDIRARQERELEHRRERYRAMREQESRNRAVQANSAELKILIEREAKAKEAGKKARMMKAPSPHYFEAFEPSPYRTDDS